VKSLPMVERLLMQAGLNARRRSQDLVAAFPEELGQGAWMFSEAT